jgi:hypothetical protein
MLLKRKPKKKTITKAGPSGISVIIPRISQRLVEISLSMQSRNVPLQMIVFVLN